MTDRIDLTKWVIHFVHRTGPHRQSPIWSNEEPYWPVAYDADKKPIFSEWQFNDLLNNIVKKGEPFEILLKILDDGHIRITWTFDKGEPCVYGPRGAVCFTEMPLHAFLHYTQSRTEDYVSNYGIAILKEDLFRMGGRPVIYGTTSTHNQLPNKDINFRGGRLLHPDCGISPEEQYRYVPLNLVRKPYPIDWMKEREWRWTDDIDSLQDLPGLPVWLLAGTPGISTIIVIVQSNAEANVFLDRLKSYYDAGENVRRYRFNKNRLANTHVLSIEELEKHPEGRGYVRLENLPLRLPSIAPPAVTDDTREKVLRVLESAKSCFSHHYEATSSTWITPYSGNSQHMIPFEINIVTYDAHSEITQALVEERHLAAFGGLGYIVSDLSRWAESDKEIECYLGAAHATAQLLSTELGQEFRVLFDRQ